MKRKLLVAYGIGAVVFGVLTATEDRNVRMSRRNRVKDATFCGLCWPAVVGLSLILAGLPD